MDIYNDQIHMRLMTANDANDYYLLIEKNRPYLEEYFPVTVSLTKTRDDTIHYINNSLQRIEQKEFYPFLILDENENLLGSVFVKSIEWNIPKAEIGYFIDHQHGRKGIVSKALSHVVNYCFERLAIRKLLIKTHESNISSRRVAEKNGFRIEGTIRYDHKTTDGRILDMVYYGLTRDE